MNPAGGPRRPIALTVAAWAAWLVGAHLALVPGVIVYLLIPLCAEAGSGNMLLTGLGLVFLLMIALSTLSTGATLAAGWDFFRSRARRGNALILVSVGSALATAGLILLARRMAFDSR